MNKSKTENRTKEGTATTKDNKGQLYEQEGQKNVQNANCVKEAGFAAREEPVIHTIEEILALPDGVRAELIDGQIYYMATPTRTHQKIGGELHYLVADHIKKHKGKCEVYMPPFAVFLNADDSIYVEPDLVVICDENKLDEQGCHGAPDWVVEVVSPSSLKLDYQLKLIKYRLAGVREYWIIHPEKRMIQVNLFEEGKEETTLYTFDNTIESTVLPGLRIRLADAV